MSVPHVRISDFAYDLPPEKIALFPAADRDDSRLLVYRNAKISHTRFSDLPGLLPTDSTLFFNNTRVIPARLLFQKDSGAEIEILLLNPVSPSTLPSEALATSLPCIWRCTIGNKKRWNDSTQLRMKIKFFEITARWHNRENDLVEF